ncbi:MAG: pilus assembly protein PilM [Candidatus Kaelpia aquatica]|nr:pilus assembly protein PilM [Candidatus Kaelpia aquatica]
MKNKKYLSLELSKKNLKIVEIEGSSNGDFKIVYYKNIAIPMLTLPGGEKTKDIVIDWDILLTQFKAEIKDRNYSNSSISLTVPSKDASDAVLTIPIIKGKDIVQFLEREIKKTTVIQEDRNNKIEYLKLGERTVKSGRVQDIFTVLADTDKLNSYLNNFASLGVKPHMFTIKPYTLYSLLQSLYPELNNIVLVDVGNELTSMVIIRDGQLKFARSMYVTIGNIAEVVSQDNNVPEKEIKDFIDQYGFKFESYPETEEGKRYKRSISRFSDKFRAELQRSILFYQEKFGSGDKISKIVLTGGGLEVADITEILKERLKLEVETLPIAKRLIADDDFKSHYSLYASCVGGALISDLKSKFNLAPKVEKARTSKRIYLEIVMVFLFVYATIYYLYLGHKNRFSAQKKQFNQVQFEIDSYPENLEQEYEDVLIKREDSARLRDVFSRLQRPYIGWEGFFTEISNLIDSTMLVVDFWVGFNSEGAMVFQIQGEYEGTYPDAQLVLRKARLSFEESDLFQNIKFEIERSGKVKIGEIRSYSYTMAGYINPDFLTKREL